MCHVTAQPTVVATRQVTTASEGRLDTETLYCYNTAVL